MGTPKQTKSNSTIDETTIIEDVTEKEEKKLVPLSELDITTEEGLAEAMRRIA